MRTLWLLFLGISALTLQSTFGHLLEISGVQPDLVLVFIVWTALRYGPVAGLYTGFFTGLVHDIYAFQWLGAHALAGCLVGYFTGLAEQKFVSLDLITKVFILGGGFVLYDLIHSMATHLGRDEVMQLLLFRTVPEGIYTLILGTLVFYFFRSSRDLDEF